MGSRTGLPTSISYRDLVAALVPPEASIEEPVEPGFVVGRFRRYATALVKMG